MGQIYVNLADGSKAEEHGLKKNSKNGCTVCVKKHGSWAKTLAIAKKIGSWA